MRSVHAAISMEKQSEGPHVGAYELEEVCLSAMWEGVRSKIDIKTAYKKEPFQLSRR